MSDAITAQEIFDAAARAVIAQGKPAYDLDRGSCVYRGRDGVKCAVGHLITDAEALRLENTYAIAQQRTDNVPVRLRPHMALLGAIQAAHDTPAIDLSSNESFVASFREGMRLVAKRFGLNADALETES